MPRQSSNTNEIVISPRVDRWLYNAVQARGYNMQEVFNAALTALLDIDNENQIRYANLMEMKKRLIEHDYKEMRERAEQEQKEKANEHAKEAEIQKSKDKLMELIIKCRPNPERISSIISAIEEERESDMLLTLMGNIRREAETTGLHYENADIRNGIKEAVKRGWK